MVAFLVKKNKCLSTFFHFAGQWGRGRWTPGSTADVLFESYFFIFLHGNGLKLGLGGTSPGFGGSPMTMHPLKNLGPAVDSGRIAQDLIPTQNTAPPCVPPPPNLPHVLTPPGSSAKKTAIAFSMEFYMLLSSLFSSSQRPSPVRSHF